MKSLLRLGAVFGLLVLVGGGCPTPSQDGATANGNGATEGTGVIVVDSPAPGATLDSPFRVEGTATTPDGNVYLRLLDSEGEVKVSSNVGVNPSFAGQEDGFLFTQVYYFGEGGDGTLEVFWQDEEGNESDHVRMPVTIE